MTEAVDSHAPAPQAGYRDVLKLVWPLALGMANNALMQFVDRVFLAHESTASLEAVLPASILAVLFIGFFQSVVAYAGTFVAQFHGAGNARGCVRSLAAGLVLALASAVFLVALIPAGHAVFDWSAHAPAVLAREKTYYTIVMAGGVFLCGSMAAQGYFTGRGLTRTVFWVNLAGNLVNIALDPLFIFGAGPIPALGIAGAAAATVLSLALQFAVLLALALRHARGREPSAHGTAPPLGALMLRILRFGLPSGAYSSLNMLSFTAFVFVTGKVGEVAFAVSNAAFAVNYLLIAPIEGFSVGAGTLVGQFQGRGDAAGAARAAHRTLFLAELYILVASALILVFHRPILGVFVADAAAADLPTFLSLGWTLFLLMVAWQFFDAADVVLSGALKGAGDTHFVMGWMLVCAFFFWLPLVAVVYRYHPTMPALWATMIAYVVVICIGTVIRWHRGAWRHIRVIG